MTISCSLAPEDDKKAETGKKQNQKACSPQLCNTLILCNLQNTLLENNAAFQGNIDLFAD